MADNSERDESKKKKKKKEESKASKALKALGGGLGAYTANAVAPVPASILMDATEKGFARSRPLHPSSVARDMEAKIDEYRHGSPAFGYGNNKNTLYSRPRESEATIAHEMGHAKNLDLVGRPAMLALRGVPFALSRLSGPMAAIYAGASEDPSYTPSLVHLGLNATTLLDEGTASLRALAHMIGKHGAGRGIRESLHLLPAFGTYAAHATAPLGIAALKKHWHKKKKQKEEERGKEAALVNYGVKVAEVDEETVQQVLRAAALGVPLTAAAKQIIQDAQRSGALQSVLSKPDKTGLLRKGAKILRNVAAVGAFAAPFAGMIGQEPMRHLNKGEHVDYQSMLKGLAPGDIVVSGSPDLSFSKGTVSLATGVPEGYHVGVVVDNKGNIVHSNPTAGIAREHISTAMKEGDRIHVLRHADMSPEAQAQWLKHLNAAASSTGGLGTGLLQEAQRHGLPPEKALEHLTESQRAMYNMESIPQLGAHELFFPKLDNSGGLDERQAFNSAHAALKRQGKKLGKPVMQRVLETERQGLGVTPTDYMPQGMDCARGTCSTVPALTMPEGHNVVPGKRPSQVTPSDYLRSPNLVPKMRVGPEKLQLHEHILKAAPHAIRAGLGLAGAGAVMGLGRLAGVR